jgi:predicted DNA-binding transcriptional regulator AlpA
MNQINTIFIPAPDYITAAVVAHLIGYRDGQEFLRNRDQLEREEDFPLPMPTCKRPMKWRKAEINAWVARKGRPASAQRHEPSSNQAMLKAAARA